MSSGRILDPPQEPAVLLSYWRDLRGTEGDCLLEYGLRLIDDRQEPDSASSKRLGAEMPVRRVGASDATDLDCAEGGPS